jgi:hypothetical protein
MRCEDQAGNGLSMSRDGECLSKRQHSNRKPFEQRPDYQAQDDHPRFALRTQESGVGHRVHTRNHRKHENRLPIPVERTLESQAHDETN